MCLAIHDLEERRLASGTKDGFEFEVVHNDIGYRCGYIRVLPGHPWFGKEYQQIDCDVHGGLTFASKGTACATHGEEAEWWVGFDCAHFGDAPDETVMPQAYLAIHQRIQREIPRPSILPPDVVRTTEYVVRECGRLARQAKRAAKTPLTTDA